MAPVCGGQPRGRRDAGAVWLGGHVKRGARDREAAISAHDPITRWTLSCSLKRRKAFRGGTNRLPALLPAAAPRERSCGQRGLRDSGYLWPMVCYQLRYQRLSLAGPTLPAISICHPSETGQLSNSR